MKEHLQTGRTEQKLNTRSKILVAAHKILEKGEDLTMESIASEARISRATIYRYYSNVDSLSTELILHLSIPNKDTMVEELKEEKLSSALLSIQNTYLDFILNNEAAARKFLGAILSSSDPKLVRGKNRLKALQSYFESRRNQWDREKTEKFIHIAVLLMGIESIIVSKDVCGLDDATSKETLQWGLEMILKGMSVS